jgi:hypothetical protein
VNGVAQPKPGSIYGDRSYTVEPLKQRKERERGRAAAVQEKERRTLARLDDMDASTRADLEVSTPDRRGTEGPFVNSKHLV